VQSEPTLSEDRLRHFFDASLAIASDLSLPVVLQRTITAACELTGARYGALGIIEDDGLIREFVLEGADPEWIERMPHPPQGLGLIGYLVDHPEALVVDEIGDHPASVGFPEGHPPMHTFLGVPIKVRDRVFGNLYLTEKSDGEPFTDADARLIAALALAASVAIQNAEYYEESEEVLIVRERERIARDLHDRVIQRIFATAMSLEAQARANEDLEVRATLRRSVDELDDTIREIRSTIFELHGPIGTDLSDAVAALVDEVTPLLGFAPIVVTEGPLDHVVREPLREQFLAALRELLTNAAKHARADTVHVSIRVGDDLSLRVADNGIGIDGVPDPDAAHGTRNLRERAQALRGEFNIRRNDDGGTTAEWVVPLAD
jgi:signal transduction histidine kinase